MKKKSGSVLSKFVWKLLSWSITAIIFIGFIYFYLSIQLPDVDELKNAELQEPLRIYTSDNKLIGEFGEMRRSPIPLEKIPKQLIQAVLATEDQRFYQHGGVDVMGLGRATVQLLLTGTKSQGGSTITMQVARNFYLSSKKTYMRKINEILLAMKIERELSKEKILELYLNKIYFGNRAYGVAAAAQVYYGKTLDQLTLAEMAMIAGLPKAPSAINPIVNPPAAKQRREHVLDRMLERDYITQKAYKEAMAAPIATTFHGQAIEVSAPYVAEMVRDALVKQYDDVIYNHGYRAYTTLDSRLQIAADEALRKALIAYDKRHGYRYIKQNLGSPEKSEIADWRRELQDMPTLNGLIPAAVIKTNSDSVLALLGDGRTITVPWSSFNWNQVEVTKHNWGGRPATPSDLYKPGDVIRVENIEANTYRIAQVPQVEGAFVAMNPQNGAVVALVGGFDYNKSNFNRVVQAQRQPGSSFKPFLYAAALEHGLTLASVINDAPIVFSNGGDQNSLWRPQNDERKFFGPTRIRVALAHSRNMVSIRLLQDIGIPYAIDFAKRFGFDPAQLPRELSLALGTGSVTPLELMDGFAVFANGGYRVLPYVIDKLENSHGDVLYQAHPKVACNSCYMEGKVPTEKDTEYAPAVISPQLAFLMNSALQDVIKVGTGKEAAKLGRTDLAGKTGTTNDKVDAWFTGFNADLVATAWVGFDQPYPLREYAAQAALPMWMDFMRIALQGKPMHQLAQPPGIVSVQIDPGSGLLAIPNEPNAVVEFFREGTAPTEQASIPEPFSEPTDDEEELF